MERKTDYPSLYPPGMHSLSWDTLSADTGFNQHRLRQLENLNRFILFVSALITPFELYIDGSFTTQKEQPGDIDCSLFFDRKQIDTMPAEDISELKRLRNRSYIKAEYGIDLYVEPDDMHRKAYWKGIFGFCHDDTTAKGIVLLKIPS